MREVVHVIRREGDGYGVWSGWRHEFAGQILLNDRVGYGTTLEAAQAALRLLNPPILVRCLLCMGFGTILLMRGEEKCAACGGEGKVPP